MDRRLGSKTRRHRIEDGTDILGAVAVRHHAHPHAGGHIEGGEPCGGAVPFVVMRAGGRVARGRDRGLVINRKDTSVVGRVGVQPDDIMDPDTEAGVVGDPRHDGQVGVLTPGASGHGGGESRGRWNRPRPRLRRPAPHPGQTPGVR